MTTVTKKPAFEALRGQKKPSFEELRTPKVLEEKEVPWYQPGKFRIPEQVSRPVKKYGGAAMGAISWPFERASTLVGTPYRALLQERAKVAQRHRAGEIIPVEEQLGSIAGALKPTVKPIAKSFISKELHPEAVTIPEVVAEDLMPDSPEWAKLVVGLAAEFAVTPAIVGGVLRAAVKGIKLTGIPAKIAAKGLPEWRRMKLRARMKTGARVERAQEVAKPLRGAEVARVAKELSQRAGKPIGKKAVQQRLSQIVKGGVTEQPSLRKLANPAIQEFVKTSSELRKLGILPKETYITKLSRKQITDLLKKKSQLQTQLQKVKEAPYRHALLKATEKLKIQGKEKLADDLWKLAAKVKKQNPQVGERLSKILEIKTTQPQTLLNFLTRFEKASLKERARIIGQLETIGIKVADQKITGLKPLIDKIKGMQRRFPGRTKLIDTMQGQIDDVTDRIQMSYKYGGTKYMPRMYTTVEEAQAARRFPVYGGKRVRAKYAKQRKQIPFEVRKRMGEIKEPAYPVVKRLIQEGADIETAKLFQQAASRPEWVSKIWRPGLRGKPLPDTKGYGALRNMFVHPKIYNDVTELVRVKNNFESLYDTLIGGWKLGKVVLNPATHFRNKISNKILLDLSGMGYAEQAKYAGKTLNHWRTKSKEYQIAKRYFARTTVIRGELLDDILRTTSTAKGKGVEWAINSLRGGVKKITKKPSELYQHEEFVNKFMKYLQQRDMGKSVIQSVEEANKWLFDYGELSRWEKLIARRAMPFYTFPRKALPRVAEALVQRPHTIAKYPLLAKMTTQYSLYKLNITEKDYANLHKVLPEYMKSGSYILMPYRDDNGDLRFFDWTYIVPWGEIADTQERGVLKSVVTNPLYQLVSDISHNKSGWTERPIWKETDLPEEKWAKQVEYIWYNLVPSLAYKGIYWDKILDAATGKPSKYGKIRPLPETIAHTIFGLRTQPIDIKRQKLFGAFEKRDQLQELNKKMTDIIRRQKAGNISKEEYNKKRQQYLQQIKDLFKK